VISYLLASLLGAALYNPPPLWYLAAPLIFPLGFSVYLGLLLPSAPPNSLERPGWVVAALGGYAYFVLAQRIIHATDNRKLKRSSVLFIGMLLANIGGCAYARLTGDLL